MGPCRDHGQHLGDGLTPAARVPAELDSRAVAVVLPQPGEEVARLPSVEGRRGVFDIPEPPRWLIRSVSVGVVPAGTAAAPVRPRHP